MTTQCKNIDVVFNFVYATTRANVFAGAIRLLNFNINFGIGAQSSMMELEIAVDQCLSAGGVGIQIPDVGRAVNFLCPSSGFSFGGIIHTATYSESGSGFIFKFKIIDPRKLLDNFSVLLKDYYCPITGIPNFFNFAFVYEGGSKCPPSINFESWPDVTNCANFGSSGPGNRSSKMGVSIKKILETIQSNKDVRILTTSGEDWLRFDASQIIQRLPQWSKIDSTSATLGNILDQAASDSSCDIVTTLEGDTIVVWAIDRTVSITQSPVDEIIRQSKNSGTLINSETGAQEIYEPSNKVVIGDKVHYLAEIESSRDNPFYMMLGYKPDGSVCYASNTNFFTEINVKPLATIINPFLAAGGGAAVGPLADTFRVREEEMLAAGSLETWMIYGRNPASLCRKIIRILGADLELFIGGLVTQFVGIGAAPNPAEAIANFRNARSHLLTSAAAIRNRETVIAFVAAHNWFSSWVNENYGTQWLIPIEEFCVNPNDRNIIQGDGGPYLLSDTPTNEGYPSTTQGTRGNILGLSLLNGPDTIFRSADDKYSGFIKINRLHAFVTAGPVLTPGIRFVLKTFNLPQDSFVIEGDDVYIKASYAGEIHKINNKAYVLVNVPKINLINDPGAIPGNQEIGNPGIRACEALLDAGGFANLVGNGNFNTSVQALNIFKLISAAGRPDAMCLPMRSNIYTYGPWYSKGKVIGSTDVILDTSLNPWNHGGYSNMNEIGQGLADQGLRVSNQEFSGFVTIAEPPGYNIGYFIRNYNIVLDSINVNYGSQGVTSTYSFRSQTPKFGEWGKAIAEGSLQSAQEVQSAKAFAMEIARKNFAGVSNIQSAMEKAKFDQFIPENRVNNASPMPFLIGFYNNNEQNNDSDGGSSPSTIPSKPSLNCEEINNSDTSDKSGSSGSNSESKDGGKTLSRYLESSIYPAYDADAAYPEGDRFYNRGGVSLDAWFTPVSIKGRNGKLSPYAKYTEPSATSDPIYRSRPVMPPLINKSKKLNIHQKYINPIISKKMLTTWDDRKGSSTAGLQIFWITYGKSFQDTTDFKKRDEAEDFGFMSLRGPLVLQSWGYDTEGKPIPNIIDSPKKAEEGTFNRNGTKNKFMTDWLSNPKSWPVGPIDLRWDRDRGVWVCPPQERIVVAQLLQTLSPLGSAKASLLNPSASGKLFYDNYSIWGDNGENIAQSIQSLQIEVYDFLKKEIPKGARVYAVNEDGKYVVIESSGPVKLSSTTDLDCETTTVESDCPDSCGLKDCLTDLGSGPAVLGLNEENCLTLYSLTECDETGSGSEELNIYPESVGNDTYRYNVNFDIGAAQTPILNFLNSLGFQATWTQQ